MASKKSTQSKALDEGSETVSVAAFSEQMDASGIDAEEFIASLVEGAPCNLRTKDCGDPGPKVESSLSDSDLEMAVAIERIIAEDNLLPVAFLAEGELRQRAVARIAWSRSGSGRGTGWLVSNSLLMTNNHVIATPEIAKDLRAEFNYQNKIDGTPEVSDNYEFDPDSFFMTNAALDFTLIRVKCNRVILPQRAVRLVRGVEGESVLEFVDESVEYTPDPNGGDDPIVPGIPDGFQDFIRDGLRVPTRPPVLRLPPLCLTPGSRWGHLQLPSSVNYVDDMHVNIIQHPRGRRKEVAVQKNQLDAQFTNHIRYTTDTDPGSSGSPVFNNAWDLLAIHHAGGEQRNGVWVNNQGVRMDRIVADLRSRLPNGHRIRTELGI